MFGDQLLIKKNPYLGYSENLIEYFSIIGYTEIFIPELISILKQNKNTNNNANINQSTLKNKNPYAPTVLSSITSKNDYGIVDNELIITQLYPENPKLISYEINQPEPEKSNVIYSFCFDSSDGKKKIFYTCFGYKFYELYKDVNTDEMYYIPKAFCIISQYPFFNTFFLICKNMHNLIVTNSNKIPLEILVYNIVNYIPSPMNSNLELYLFGNENETSKIQINQLSGYPNIDFELYEIFNILPLNIILLTYILTFLEQSILFFSSNLEYLNIIIYIFYMFNYPCNDSTYYWHIVSVGKNDLIEENKYVGKIMVSFLGVNATYNDNIDTYAFSDYHYIVDIDNKKIIFKESLNISMDQKEESIKINLLYSYIDSIFKEKNVNSYYLKQPLLNLKNHLEVFLTENILNYSTNPRKNNVNFFKDEIKNIDISKKILEFFYDCNLSLLTKFYNDNELNTSFDKIVKEENNNFDDSIASIKNYSDEEKIFVDLFRSTIKYKIYFDNFMKDFEVMDVFKIPFLFSEKFIELKLKDKEQNKICCDNLGFFSIIDYLYRLTNKQKIMTKKITFNYFYQHYLEKLSKYFKSFFISDYDNSIFENDEIKQYMIIVNKPNNQLINFNKKIINRYMYLLQNSYENKDIEEIFPHFKTKEDRVIKIIDRRIIYQVIKNKLIDNKFISPLNFLIYSLIYVVCLTITLHPFDQMISYLLQIQNSIKLINFFMRDNIYTLIKSIYKYYLINKQIRKYPTMILTHVKMYFCILANFIRQIFIVPNEEMMIILKNFFSEIIFQERKELNILDEENKHNLNKKKEVNNNEDFYKTKNYLVFMKHCFHSKGMIKSKTMVDSCMEESGNFNSIIKSIKNYPEIVIKIKDYVYSCKFYQPLKLYRDAENLFEDFFDNYNLNIESLNIQKLREIILNLIIYGSELENEPIPLGFLINTLYILRNFEDDYQNKKKEEKSE